MGPKAAWHEHLKCLRALDPTVCVGSPDSEEAVSKWTAHQRQQAVIFSETNESLHQYFNKNGVRLARYAAMFALSDYVDDPHGNAARISDGHQHPFTGFGVKRLVITMDQYLRAATFIDEFLVPHQLYLHQTMLGGRGQYMVRAKQVLDRVLALGLTTLTRRDLYTTPGLRTKVKNEEWDLTQFGNFMVQCGWLTPGTEGAIQVGVRTPGRRRNSTWCLGCISALAAYAPEARVRIAAQAMKRKANDLREMICCMEQFRMFLISLRGGCLQCVCKFPEKAHFSGGTLSGGLRGHYLSRE